MRALPHAAKGAFPIDLVRLSRLYRNRLPLSERPHYDAYASHLGRDDFVGATKIAEERSDPQLWVSGTPEQYRDIRQAYSLAEKVTCEGDRKATDAAWRKFLNCESRCGRTNRKMRYVMLRPDRLVSISRGAVRYRDLCDIRNKIAYILGDFWSAYRFIVKQMPYGKGMSVSSTDVRRTSVPFKLSDNVTITSDAVPVWRDFLTHGGFIAPWVKWSFSDGRIAFREVVQIVPGCKITFVPKTSVIKRTIAIEPSANVSMQLAVHRYIARRLHKVGIDISDQTRNRSLALEGSLTGALGTIDLSSASDLVSKELVRLLLPKSWYELLDALRSKVGRYSGRDIALEKFSSMGNGFTFALETVIFYAIAKAMSDREGAEFNPSVYGDDIIVQATVFDSTVKALEFFGFKVNTKKSFNSGPFRESCGLDAFHGVDVRPVFIRSKQLRLVELYALHNHFYRRKEYEVCKFLINCVPEPYRFFGPPGPEAGFLFTEDPLLLSRTRKYHKDTQSWAYQSIAEIGRRITYSERLLLESSLHSGGEYSSGAPLRGVTKLVIQATHRDY